MAATEIKRYTIRPESWSDFLETWREIVNLRRRHGFGILFAFRDPETHVFTWAINHEGDFDQAAQGYYNDPDRIKFDNVVDFVSAYEIRKVDPVPIPQ